MTVETECLKARAEHAERQLRAQALALGVLRGAARELVRRCECRGTGKRRQQRGFFIAEVECDMCLALREALATGEIV